MNVTVDGETAQLRVLPRSKPNNKIRFRALMDLFVDTIACSAFDSNGGSFKPIQYAIERD